MFSRVIIGAASALFAAAFPASAEDPALSEAQWAHPQSDLLSVLTQAPGECLRPAENEETAYLVEAGRVAFRSPLLFGGTAARSGLSCNSCHRNGHDNPDFYLEGLSDDPGTADVTSALFSKTREDNVFNPLIIPTLIDAAKKDTFGASPAHPTLEDFISSAVETEFQGVASEDLIHAVSVYVGQLDSAFCPEEPEQRTVGQAIGDVESALKAAAGASQRGDGAMASFLLGAAQQELGRVYERYFNAGLEAEAVALTALSRKIADERSKTTNAGTIELAPLFKSLTETETILTNSENRSLYNKDVLKSYIEKD
jgi:hypothetical protein